MDSQSEFQYAYETALILLKRERDRGNFDTSATLESVLDTVLSIPEYAGKVDRAILRRRLETDLNIFVPAPFILDGNEDTEHKPWLDAKRPEIDWQLWTRYERFLRGKWPPKVVESVNSTTDLILDRLEDPASKRRRFYRRGMIVGQVQSGKTANYTGLICKAVDSGYKIILVLAGNHDNLRSQTQMRLDEEFLGYDTAQFESGVGPIGVGLVGGVKPIPIAVTTRDQKGDFNTAAARRIPMQLSDTPILLVVKKNVRILRTIYNYFIRSRPARNDPALAHPIVDGVPLLLIDDEADLASVNTADIPIDEETGKPIDNYNPSRINEWIRRILSSFGMKSYVGYTATPFANIFIPPETIHRDLGPDLFPQDFIITLASPSDYTGPVEVFGLGDDRRPPLPVVRYVDDFRPFIPNGHPPDFRPGPLPRSLKTALKSFILSCAIRRVRGQENEHNSMLIHVTRYTQVQMDVAELVERELQSLTNRIRFGDGEAKPSVLDELRTLWESDYVQVSRIMDKTRSDETWDRIEAELAPAVSKVKLKIINGRTSDILDYKENSSTGTNIIAVGGDKLSRGLTLEGLTVSYFLRATTLYDTLMQMGRWFGFRLNYEDLCRIYLTHELSDWFQHITLASEELRKEFEFMMAENMTPRDYGLRVRSHPLLMVTSRVKMRYSEEIVIHYADTTSQTRLFDLSPKTVRGNFDNTRAFIAELGLPSQDEGHRWHIWRNVAGNTVSRYLAIYSTHRLADEVKGKYLSEYIDKRLRMNELTNWTVAVRILDQGVEGVNAGDAVVDFGNCRVNASKRSPFRYSRPDKLDMHTMTSKDDESLDLSPEQKTNARRKYQDSRTAFQLTDDDDPDLAESTEEPEDLETLSHYMRRERPATNGLLILYVLDNTIIEGQIRNPSEDLSGRIQQNESCRIEYPLIGFAVSFPPSRTAVPISYRVNTIYSSQAAGQDE